MIKALALVFILTAVSLPVGAWTVDKNIVIIVWPGKPIFNGLVIIGEKGNYPLEYLFTPDNTAAHFYLSRKNLIVDHSTPDSILSIYTKNLRRLSVGSVKAVGNK